MVEAIKRGYTDITLIGFDRLLHPDREDDGPQWLAHDKRREHDYLMSLPARIRELG